MAAASASSSARHASLSVPPSGVDPHHGHGGAPSPIAGQRDSPAGGFSHRLLIKTSLAAGSRRVERRPDRAPLSLSLGGNGPTRCGALAQLIVEPLDLSAGIQNAGAELDALWP